jgi:hypothetical protein
METMRARFILTRRPGIPIFPRIPFPRESLGMTVEYGFDERHRVFTSTFIGPCTFEDYLESTARALEAFEKHGTAKGLIDFRKGENRADLDALYGLPDLYERIYPHGDIRIGILTIRGHKDGSVIRFYETICLNRGWMAKVFYEYDEAMEWLGSS